MNATRIQIEKVQKVITELDTILGTEDLMSENDGKYVAYRIVDNKIMTAGYGETEKDALAELEKQEMQSLAERLAERE